MFEGRVLVNSRCFSEGPGEVGRVLESGGRPGLGRKAFVDNLVLTASHALMALLGVRTPRNFDMIGLHSLNGRAV